MEERNEDDAVRNRVMSFRDRRAWELAQTIAEAEAIRSKPGLHTGWDRDELNYLVAKIALLRDRDSGAPHTRRRSGPLTLEERAFREVLYSPDGNFSQEARDLMAGTQGPLSWSAGGDGGYTVPMEYEDQLTEAMTQFDPLTDEQNVGLISEPSLQMRPKQLMGWDLSAVSSVQIGEGIQAVKFEPQQEIGGDVLNGWMHKTAQFVSMEFDQDTWRPTIQLMMRLYGVAFARGMGKQLVNGTGTLQPQGLLTGAANSEVTTANSGTLVLDDFLSIYFSIDRCYRVSPKCAWVMADATYQMARKAVDSNNRPLLSLRGDDEVILGKKVLVSPSMPSAAGSAGIVFGDLSHFIVRLSATSVRNAMESAAVEYGKYLFLGYKRVDSFVFDPSAGAAPPIVYATLHS